MGTFECSSFEGGGRLVSVDVGLHGLGMAVWEEGEGLLAAWYQPASEKGRGPEAWRRLAADVPRELGGAALVVETMVHYEGSRIDPADLLELQGVCGCLVMALPWSSVAAVEARTWSEGIPKEVRHARLQRLLDVRGWRDRVDVPKAKARMSDVLDAVGVGLWWCESKSTRRWRAGGGLS